MKIVALTIEYDGQQHTIRLKAASKEAAIRELKALAMSADDGMLADTIHWLFNDVWQREQA
jgi:hypothetical protein